MSNELTTINNAPATITDADLVMHLENIGLLKDLKVGEKNTFIQIAKAFNLNPFKREIHVSKYGDTMSIIVGYETYIKRAERSGVLDGWNVATTGTAKDNDLKAIITIYRKDRTQPFVWEAKYSEYVQKTKEGNPNKFWQKAETMTKKVAMAQGFRLCFNDELGGMPYTADEMGNDAPQDIPHTEVVADIRPLKIKVIEADPFNLTPESQSELVSLIKSSTLDTKSADAAAGVIAGAKDQATIDKVKARLLQVQTPSI